MLFFKTRIAPSPLHERGLFAAEPIPMASTVGIMTIGAKLTSERIYQEAQAQGDATAIQTGTRWFGRYFMYDDTWMHEDFINHSFEANLILLAGVLIAGRDIAAGEEITCDYRFILAHGDQHRFTDRRTGRAVDGLPAHAAVSEACHQLLRVLDRQQLDAATDIEQRLAAVTRGEIPNILGAPRR